MQGMCSGPWALKVPVNSNSAACRTHRYQWLDLDDTQPPVSLSEKQGYNEKYGDHPGCCGNEGTISEGSDSSTREPACWVGRAE